MAFIPNTTPTPNWLYNGEMKKMSDVELRVVLVVTRATLGWEENPETGMRKQEDWISRGQIVEKTGRSSSAISRAIHTCIKHGWIEARSKEGVLLDTTEKRSGNRLYFRLGGMFMDKLKTSAKSTQVVEQTEKPVLNQHRTSAKSTPQPVLKVHSTKETLTKKTIQNKFADSNESAETVDQIKQVLDIFYRINPTLNYGNKTQRAAAAELIKKLTFEKTIHMAEYAVSVQGQPFSPTITTPYQLKDKVAILVAFYQKETNSKPKGVTIAGL